MLISTPVAGFRDDNDALRAKHRAAEERLRRSELDREALEAKLRQSEEARTDLEAKLASPPTSAAPSPGGSGTNVALGLFIAGVLGVVAIGLWSATPASRPTALSQDDVFTTQPTGSEDDIFAARPPEEETDPRAFRARMRAIANDPTADPELREIVQPRLPLDPRWSATVTASEGSIAIGTTCEIKVESGIGPVPSAAVVDCQGEILFFGIIPDEMYPDGPCQLHADRSVALDCEKGDELIHTGDGVALLRDERGQRVELEVVALLGT